MHKFYYLTGAMILVLGGLGIYSSQAGNKMMSNSNDNVYIEETVYSVPSQEKTNNQKRRNPTPDSIQNDYKNSSGNMQNGGFMPLPQDKGVEVAPINPEPELEQQPNAEIVIEEDVVQMKN